MLPENEARLVVEAVLEDLAGGRPDNLDRAGRAWGRAHRSVSEMVGRLSSLREALAANGVNDPLRMHRAVDRVTAGATEEVLHRLEHASRTDALTGVGNRRAFDEVLTASLSAASRQGHDVTVVAVDLDGLKRINDSEGHAAGDAVLLALVRSFYVALRDEDTVFRVGGDEFVILLPFTSVGAAELLMERIQTSGAPKFTWGAAGYPGDASDASALVDAADHDLYRRREARRGGRPAPRRRTSLIPLRAEQSSNALRWAWIPAAAVILVSLVATLVATTSHGPNVTAKGKHHQPSVATAPQGSKGGSTPPSGTGSGSGSIAPGGSGSSTPSLVASYVPAPTGTTAPTASGGGSPSTGGSPPPASPPPSSSGGGVLGTVSGLVAPLPLLGGSTGLVAVVNQILTGSPTTTAGTNSASSTSNSGNLIAHILG